MEDKQPEVNLETGVVVFQPGCHYYRIKGGMLGKHHSEETKQKISNSHKNASPETKEIWRQNVATAHQHITKESLRKLSLALTGKPRSKEVVERLSITQKTVVKELWKDPEYRNKHLEAIRSEKTRAKVREASREHWRDPEIRARQLKAMLKASFVRPTTLEQRVQALLDYCCPEEYRYTGNGDNIVFGLCPDFTSNNGHKKFIEVNGCYYHACEECGFGNVSLGKETAAELREHDKVKIENYKAFGYSTLVIWEHEVKDNIDLKPLIERIKDFNSTK